MLKRISWTYQGNCYTIDWMVVSIFVLFAGSAILADRLKKPFDSLIFVGLLLVSIVWFFILLERSRKAKAVEDKIVFNLTIEIQCHKRNFDKTLLHSVEDEIEYYGLAIHRAKRYLKGNWKVTEKGYLIRGFAQDIENHTAFIDIDDVMPELVVLEKVLADKEQMRENSCQVQLHFAEGGVVVNVKTDGNRLCLN